MTKHNPDTRGLHDGKVGRPRWATDPDQHPPGILPPPGYVVVVGRSPMIFWDNPKRARFSELVAAAAEFGLSVQEIDGATESPRRSWTANKVDTDYAADTVRDFPGITFDDWVLDLYMRDQPKDSPVAWKAARNRGKVALSKLVSQGRVVKVWGDDGKMRLWVPGQEPKVDASKRPDPRRDLPPAGDPRIGS